MQKKSIRNLPLGFQDWGNPGDWLRVSPWSPPLEDQGTHRSGLPSLWTAPLPLCFHTGKKKEQNVTFLASYQLSSTCKRKIKADFCTDKYDVHSLLLYESLAFYHAWALTGALRHCVCSHTALILRKRILGFECQAEPINTAIHRNKGEHDFVHQETKMTQGKHFFEEFRCIEVWAGHNLTRGRRG